MPCRASSVIRKSSACCSSDRNDRQALTACRYPQYLTSTFLRRIQEFVVLGHVPGPHARWQLQEFKILLEVIQDVAVQLLLLVAVDVIGETAPAQVHLGAVVVAVVVLGLAVFGMGKA